MSFICYKYTETMVLVELTCDVMKFDMMTFVTKYNVLFALYVGKGLANSHILN